MSGFLLKRCQSFCAWQVGSWVLVGLLCVGCGSETGGVAGDVVTVACEAVGDNLLRNPEFATAGGSKDRLLEWGEVQHAGDRAFETEVASGVLSITKTAEQPWFVVTQRHRPQEYVGRLMRYSAELKLDLNADNLPYKFEAGGGLSLLIYGETDDPGPIPVDELLLNGAFQHEPSIGQTGWFEAEFDFMVPEKATRMLLGFRHQG